MHTVRFVSAIFCLSCVHVQAQQRQPVRVPICDLFHNLRDYAGRLVEVEGIYTSGLHGAELAAPCCRGVVLDGHEWRSVFCPVGASAPPPFKRSEVTFTTDDASVKRLWAFYNEARANDKSTVVFATFVGEVQIKDSYAHPMVDPQARYAYGPGFCHVGSYPAVLVIKEVTAFREVKRALDQPECTAEREPAIPR